MGRWRAPADTPGGGRSGGGGDGSGLSWRRATLATFAATRPSTVVSRTSPVSSSSAVNALLALIVALALQIGTNYVNDYADGVRGTDEVRVGPVRLVAGKLASVRQVKLAALASFGVAGLAGLDPGHPGLLLVHPDRPALRPGRLGLHRGAAPLRLPRTGGAARLRLLRSGGHGRIGLRAACPALPHGYSSFPWAFAVWVGVPVGLLATALLQANNLRDVETDKETGKMTVAVRLGRGRAGLLYVATLVATGRSRSACCSTTAAGRSSPSPPCPWRSSRPASP